MSDIYIVVKQGVYRHDITGAYSSAQRAREVATGLAFSESDHWHEFQVIRLSIDGDGKESLIGAAFGSSRNVVPRTVEWSETARS